MRAAVALLLGLVTWHEARAADPVDAPVVTSPDVRPGRPQPAVDLPEWLATATGLHHARVEPQDGGRLRWNFVPFVISNPLEGVGLGLATLVGFRIGASPSTGYSSVAASAVTTTRSQRTLDVRSELRLPGNRWILVGDFAVNHFPSPAWGVGGDRPD